MDSDLPEDIGGIEAPDIAFLTRGVSPEEAAAVSAVLAAALAEGSDHVGATEAPVPSAWDRGRRSLRSTITPGPGRWRSFTG
ncbi:acyl-CoA carboxylase epsilon subunit [Glaciibacter flavus]|uniref:acyl-CoA carboxylase epsilon subunit n=1 Tax=Orlajensenia flava TaxID=2565934 RepID=UPI003B005913